MESDTLRVVTMTSPTDFYIFRGQPFGLEYYKVRDFAKAHGLYLDIHLTNQIDTLHKWLQEGAVDLSITPLPMTRSHHELYTFCGMVERHSLVLVRRKGGEEEPVRVLSDLADKEVFVEHHSAAELRLRQIQEEIGAGEEMKVHALDSLSAEEMLLTLAEPNSHIQYLVTEERLAHLFSTYIRSLDVVTPVSTPVQYAWAVVRQNNTLSEEINHFFSDEERKSTYLQLQEQDASVQFYLKENQRGREEVTLHDGAISPYDHLFQEEATRLGWHWTYLAAIAYQESRFRPEVIGWSGARGLMGIMPATGRAFGASADQLLLPEVSVSVAVDCLLFLMTSFKDYPPADEQVYFTLAAYNAGLGHIQDAQRLASKYGAPPDEWYGSVREYSLLKSNPEYYNDPVVRYGYMRGRETVRYVDEITDRQMAYSALVRNKKQHTYNNE